MRVDYVRLAGVPGVLLLNTIVWVGIVLAIRLAASTGVPASQPQFTGLSNAVFSVPISAYGGDLLIDPQDGAVPCSGVESAPAPPSDYLAAGTANSWAGRGICTR